MTDHSVPLAGGDQHVIDAMQDRLRSMHVTLLFMAVLLCVLVGMNVVVLAAD